MTGPDTATSAAEITCLGHLRRAEARRRLERRTLLAWLTSLASKVGTFGTQLVAVPMVYRTLGQDGYAAYAAVTTAVSILGALNLGIGGSLVTPMAHAAVLGGKRREAELFRAGVVPLGLICMAALALILPVMMMVPLPALLGEVARANVDGLRSGLVVACVATLVSLPLTVVGNLRQAYQELHISNLVGAVGNGALCAALVTAAHAGAGLAAFVACFVGIPLAANVLNGGILFAGRPYLLTGWKGYEFRQSLTLAGDGLWFLAADFTYTLLYQWPVYLMARNRPTAQSAAFAVSAQMVLLPLSFLAGIFQPFWGTTAEAVARGDVAWLRGQVKRVRSGAVAAGLALGFVIAVWGEQIARLWLGSKVELAWGLRLFAGTYLILAIWEYLHFVLTLGTGRIREASMMVFARSAGFAIVAPVLISLGGGIGLWLGLCCSVVAYTAWRMPRVLETFLGSAER